MVKRTIKSEIFFDSNCSTIEVIEKLKKQFEDFREIYIEIKENEYSKFGYPFNYKVVFYHDFWVDLTKIEY
jgi:hypothetical protein